ncbi:hypothetical protein [Salinibacillus xinjiangensis]|uniref:DUF4181 domain-containing protein n=1 Tax=Salinibacillus xinjiangensis TaxID=1229268 RepID=A0A6G1X5E8_9BACI|nr:hypothetical protein [Salinibacillus xinjiangensis]MRG86149.1 hypothetical protein [Salinibacillus xinjiangensis]
MNFSTWNLEDILLFIFCIFLLLDKFSTIRERKQVKEDLKEIDDNQILLSKWKKIGLLIVGAFIFKWLLYFIATAITKNFIVIIISLILITLELYKFTYNIKELQKSKLGQFLLYAETVYILVFSIYYFGYSLT